MRSRQWKRAMPAPRNCADPRACSSAEHFWGVRVAALPCQHRAWLTITLLPYEVSTLSDGYRAGPLELAGSPRPSSLRSPVRKLLGQTIAFPRQTSADDSGIAIALAATLGCLLTDHIVPIVALRLLFGVGTGIVAAATNALLHYMIPLRSCSRTCSSRWECFRLAIFVVGAVQSFAGREAVFFVDLIFLRPSGPRPSSCQRESSPAFLRRAHA